jgi:hypothetical protein
LVEERVAETRQQMRADLEEAQDLYAAGEIDKDGYDALIEQSLELAEARLKEIPEEAAALITADREKFQQRGKQFAFGLLEILLLAAGGGLGAGASTISARRRRQAPTE